jgi:hypothetical protein
MMQRAIDSILYCGILVLLINFLRRPKLYLHIQFSRCNLRKIILLKSYPINPPIVVVMVAVSAVRCDKLLCIHLGCLNKIVAGIVSPAVTCRIQVDL